MTSNILQLCMKGKQREAEREGHTSHQTSHLFYYLGHISDQYEKNMLDIKL